MSNRILISFSELDIEDQPRAGGKGDALARLYKAGYPVPDGFVILPSAFEGDNLRPQAWSLVKKKLDSFRKKSNSFAVRSSALAEDSAQASFGGQFETVLDVYNDKDIHDAILAVRKSRSSERVQSYSKAKGLDFEHEIAVVVQQLVHSEISGVLFTRDPLTGRDKMVGNYIHGLGDKLVSGEVDALEFTLDRAKGQYDGPAEFRKYAKRLFNLSKSIEKELGLPQDIEWAIAGGKVYILQSRPVTTLIEGDPVTYDYNSTRTGDYLWVDNGGPYPEPMTPASWSVNSIILRDRQAMLLGNQGARAVGMIGMRYYINFSFTYAILRKVGRKHDDIIDMMGISTGPLPEDIKEIPPFDFSLKQMLSATLRRIIPAYRRQRRLVKNSDAILARNPDHCKALVQQVKAADENQLVSLWNGEIKPLFSDMFEILDAFNENHFNTYVYIRKILQKLVGIDETNNIIASMGGGLEDAASISLSLGLVKVLNGEMTREEYITECGHRHANENELAVARPYEDPDWLDKQLEEYRKSSIDVQAMIDKRTADFAATWKKLEKNHPVKTITKLRAKIDELNKITAKREKIRSEMTRSIGVIRELYLRAGELTGLGDDVFFITYQELVSILSKADETALSYIPARKETFEKYKLLPPLPTYIRGRFDPENWTADPNRRMDYYDPEGALAEIPASDTVTGVPGSSGRVEGIIRFIKSPEEGSKLQKGEILLASTTNIGWTTIFPKAAAVITDTGASLAHAAIVARELGIPAVVGCSNATTRLKTGDRVLVDGGQGTIRILEQA
ncbi:MAG: PEP/pyruvate-binding domain-containing protein [Candidatus Odinarchaeota archaeon]